MRFQISRLAVLLLVLIAVLTPAYAEGNAGGGTGVLEVAAGELVASLPRWWEDEKEPAEIRDHRLSNFVRAMVVVTNGDEERLMMLTTVSWWESRLASHVHAGNCKPHECDHGHAKGMPQVQLASGVDKDLWLSSEGHDYEATLASMEAANWVFDQAIARCGRNRGMEHKLFFFYAKGYCPGQMSNKSQAFERWAWYDKRLRQLRALKVKAQSAFPKEVVEG